MNEVEWHVAGPGRRVTGRLDSGREYVATWTESPNPATRKPVEAVVGGPLWPDDAECRECGSTDVTWTDAHDGSSLCRRCERAEAAWSALV